MTTLGATHKASAEAFRQGLNVGFEGLTALPWVEFDGLRSIHLALLSLRSVCSGDVLKMEESLRRHHYKFTGDAKLAQAMKESGDTCSTKEEEVKEEDGRGRRHGETMHMRTSSMQTKTKTNAARAPMRFSSQIFTRRNPRENEAPSRRTKSEC